MARVFCYIAKGRRCGAVTLVTLSHVTDAATMAKISFWRYLAVNRKTLFAALACALLVFSMLGCGTSNDLKSIQLSTSNATAAPPGTLDLTGEGATLQLYLWGNFSNGTQKLLNSRGDVAYQVFITPDSVDQFGDPLPTPPQTIMLSTTGLITAVQPFICTWQNSAVPPATTPAWGLSGSYSVTATYAGLTSPPVFVAVATQAGINPNGTNPTGACGPTS
jgi:hypothetical protein